MDHSAAMKSLNTSVDTLEAVGAGAGVTVSAAQGYLPEKSTLPKIFDGSVEEWRGWKYDFADFLDTSMYLFLEEIAKSRDELVGDSFIQKWFGLGARATKDQVAVWRALKGLTGGTGQNDCHVSWILS